ncbi:MAG: tetratricopeptide repeat protein [Deltaproteobacteria bacterium]|nr:tetratricopeptide repeat protein [Deltaproteobacteria bacterium]
MTPHASVIYVRFDGPWPGKLGRSDPGGDRGEGDLAPNKSETHKADHDAGMPQVAGETYTLAEVGRLFDVSESRLRYWDRSGFLKPSGYDGQRRVYTFQDLVGIRSAKTLLDGGVTLQRARRILSSLKEKLPRSAHPLGRLRILGDSRTVTVIDEEREFDADSGQLLLDFSVSSITDSIISTLAPRRSNPGLRTGYDWYMEGCRLDEDEATLAQAEEAYHRAIYLDPSMANAYTNLGNLMYRTGKTEDARVLYRKAVEIDPDQPEAHYNLGFLCFETSEIEEAERCFSVAVGLDSTFADAHFNLAMTKSRLGRADEARVHWERYLEIEPMGPWADIAREKLSEPT